MSRSDVLVAAQVKKKSRRNVSRHGISVLHSEDLQWCSTLECQARQEQPNAPQNSHMTVTSNIDHVLNAIIF